MDETPLPRISVSTFDAETFVADEESTTGLEKSDGLKHQSLASNFQSDSHVTYPIDKDDYESKMEDDMLSDLGQLETSLSFSAFFKIVMMRTGTFSWHNKNIFCGWYDSQLTEKGKQEIYEASILLKNENYTFDLAFCSALSRCRESLDILLNELNLNDIEVHQTWELNERHCGGLTGYSNAELDAKYGREQVNFWLNSPNQSPPEMTKEHKFYDGVYGNPFLPTNIDLPRTESLKMMQDRFKNFWNKHVCPRILSGRKILLVTHNGGLQSLVHYLDDIEDINFFDTKIPRATPFYYKLDETLININNDLERRIADSFEVFDHAANKSVDMREIGTIIRSLGCVPTEAEIQEILVSIENLDAPTKGTVHLASFLPYMSKKLFEHKFQPATPDALLAAFRKIDIDSLGYITKEQFVTLMTQEGEPFTEEEMEETLTIALDPTTQTVPYEYYINQIMYDPDPDNDIYLLADHVKATTVPKSVRTTSQILREALLANEASEV